MANSQILELKDRAAALYASLIADPDRPFWQAELTAILLAQADIMALLSSDYISCAGDLTALREKIASLELRYSELLYRMSERT